MMSCYVKLLTQLLVSIEQVGQVVVGVVLDFKIEVILRRLDDILAIGILDYTVVDVQFDLEVF